MGEREELRHVQMGSCSKHKPHRWRKWTTIWVARQCVLLFQ